MKPTEREKTQVQAQEQSGESCGRSFEVERPRQ
jgi:hypothetical protein